MPVPGTPVSRSVLLSLVSSATAECAPSATARAASGGYGRDADALRRRIQRDPGDARAYAGGGAFPEVHEAQFPMGRHGAEQAGEAEKNKVAAAMLQTGMSLPQLQRAAGRAALANRPGPAPATDEWNAVKDYLRRHAASVTNGLRTLSRPDTPHVRRVSRVDADAVLDDVLRANGGEGEPVVVRDGFRDWPAFQGNDGVPHTPWTFHGLHLARTHGGDPADDARFPPLMANDRAPARHRDKNVDKRVQTVALVGVDDFVQYVVDRDGAQRTQEAERDARSAADASPRAAPPTHEPTDPPDANAPPPFYLNGWRAFSESAAMRAACPGPYFAEGVDHNRIIMKEVAQVMGGKVRASSDLGGAFTDWADTSERALTKVFLGPRHTTTRLHFDAGGAHAWLGQVVGRKWIVLYPPSDAQHLSVLNGEIETVQSAVDPLRESLRAEQATRVAADEWRAWLAANPPAAHDALDTLAYHAHARPVQTVLHPGEAILVPKGWWHYALSLDPSITVMRNFYEKDTNVKDCVAMVTKHLAGAIAQVKATASR